jgi:predicted N-acetyltransferase YhbS
MAQRLFPSEVRLHQILPLNAIAPDQVESLLDAAFGTDRRGRTAYLLRQGVGAVPALSFAACLEDGAFAGTIQCWPVALREDGGEMTPLTLVGPVAVSPEHQGSGIGKRLMETMLQAAEQHGHDALVMIGDPEYYGRFFGFSAGQTGGWKLPGPWEPHRLLARLGPDVVTPKDAALMPDPAFARSEQPL